MRSGLDVMEFAPTRAVRGTTSTERLGGFLYPGWYAIIAAGALFLSFLVALRDQVPSWELRLTEWLNSAPDTVATVLYPLMQLGTLAAPLLVAARLPAVGPRAASSGTAGRWAGRSIAEPGRWAGRSTAPGARSVTLSAA